MRYLMTLASLLLAGCVIHMAPDLNTCKYGVVYSQYESGVMVRRAPDGTEVKCEY